MSKTKGLTKEEFLAIGREYFPEPEDEVILEAFWKGRPQDEAKLTEANVRFTLDQAGPNFALGETIESYREDARAFLGLG